MKTHLSDYKPSRKSWWLLSLLSTLLMTLIVIFTPGVAMAVILCVLCALPWVVFSCLRILATGNTPYPYLLSVIILAGIWCTWGFLGDEARAAAAALAVYATIMAGIITLSYMVICGCIDTASNSSAHHD